MIHFRNGMAILVLFCGVLQTQAQNLIYTALMDGPSESPPNASPGTGTATVYFELGAQTMRIVADFTGLTGTTTAAHIHAATPVPFAGTAGVATQTPSFSGFPLGVTTGTMDTIFDMTSASSWNPTFITINGGTPAGAEAAFLTAMFEGRAYFNIHSSTFPGGEIRGFFVAVPEPSTIALVSLGVVGAAGYWWNRRRIALRNRFKRA